MNCPKCHHELEEIERKSIQLDFCPSCHGVLFNQHELTQSLTTNLSLLEEGKHISIMRGRIRLTARSTKICPKCNQQMREFNYGYAKQGQIHSTDIIINSCLDCQIVWLDNGEFEAIKVIRGIT